MAPLAESVAAFYERYGLSSQQEGNARKAKSWSVNKSSSLYKINAWGSPYFSVNAEGNITVRPFGRHTKQNEEIDIFQTLEKAMEDKVLGDDFPFSPIILRFPDILKDRLETLQSAFDSAIQASHYEGRFQGVFPVKCNQDRSVVENIVKFGTPFHFGLEAGSKAELLLAMSSLCSGSPHALLVCNGYKDADYVALALLARKLRLNSFIVLEQEEELDLVINLSRSLCIEPLIGLRAKLHAKHNGHFGETSGENGKFGLTCMQIVNIVSKLRRCKMLHCLQLLHFHIGSQIPSLSVLYDGVSEAAHIYCELSNMGANMHCIDIGGGLGVDYDGSHFQESDMSVGYTVEEYAREVVLAVKDACYMKGVKQPTLCSESGRAIVSHHSVLVFDVVSAEEKIGTSEDEGVPLQVDGTLPDPIRRLCDDLAALIWVGNYESAMECANSVKLSSVRHFKKGELSLMHLASVNTLYDLIAGITEKRGHKMSPETSYDAVYHINLSIFRSMPDTWAIGQLFPIVPLQRLDEEPTIRAILSDLTCDSDGKISTFVGHEGMGSARSTCLRVHPLVRRKRYYLGMFLGGAYQEALGGIHNLFGAPPVVQISWKNRREMKTRKLQVSKVRDGQTISDVLKCMQFEPSAMLQTLHLALQRSLKDGLVEEEEDAMRALDCSFSSTTYLSTARSVASALLHTAVIG
ncbi:hypothetical protein KP509_14G033900 [Ceratopteris richardii]|uniref:Arginine decarboxylase n=1 Tax=Ceratopteris richardii TaxID=49495 RepID=A0A8T2T8U4_CERRI|nr:hypothetical protein KP509_14G033900 [Ceratopteris richardii]